MHKQMKELQQLSGIGKVLSQRLVENGYDTISKLAAAQTKGLERIPGMHPKQVRTIVAEARKMTGEAEKGRHTWLEEKGEGKARQA
jgi:predicted flap endonuclease-1-like 5' DNA nuclease